MRERPKDIIRDCADFTALTVQELVSIAATAPRRYYVWQIDKRSGNGKRTVCHPARELKAVQEYFLRCVLHDLPVHVAATAYVRGSSIKKNAFAHADSRVVLKLDFKDFFNSLTVANWKKYAADQFPHWTVDERKFSNQILCWGRGSYQPKCLAIGAPTSPLISNALMFEVDQELSTFASQRGLTYTRYADDITFSSKGQLDRNDVVNAVQRALASAKYTKVRLNPAKTVLVSNRFSRRVTGLIITPDKKVSLGRDRKRLISAMVHRAQQGKLSIGDRPRLAGLLAFALDVEPTFVARLRRKYSSIVVEEILKPGNGGMI